MCYDVADVDSINACKNLWLPAALEHCKDPVIILVGCKIDNYPDYELHPTIKELMEDENNRIKTHLTCSSKTGKNVENVFRSIGTILYQHKCGFTDPDIDEDLGCFGIRRPATDSGKNTLDGVVLVSDTNDSYFTQQKSDCCTMF